MLVNAVMDTFEFSLNYQQLKVGISANHAFPFIAFVKLNKATHKYYLIF